MLSKENLMAGDVWGVGTLVHELISKTMPLDYRSYGISSSYANFSAKSWNEISYECVDFCHKALFMDPKQRLTLDQALSHPWLVKNDQIGD